MRFLRVSLVALMILTLVGGAALADTADDTSAPATESTTDSSTTPSSDSTSDPAELDEAAEPGETAESDEAAESTETTEPGSEVEEVEYEEPAPIVLPEGEFKGVVSAVTPAEGDSSATVTVLVDGEEVTFTAEQLGLTPEAMAMVTVGAEFKYENEEGKLELKVSGESGTVKLERKADGSMELKLETGHPGKGKEISEENKARAEEHKQEAQDKAEKAREKAEKARENGKGHGKSRR